MPDKSKEVSPVAERTPRVSFLPFLLYGLTGFTAVLAEQGFEKYMSLLVGATAAAGAIVIATYFLGFALGSWIVGSLIRSGSIENPLRTYGVLEFLIGGSALTFSYMFHGIVTALAPWEAVVNAAALRLATRFAFGSLLILPTAGLMGASFPLIADVVDRLNASSGHSWLRAYGSNLLGAVLAALLGAYMILPVIGIRGAFWLCFGICSLVFTVCMVARPNLAGFPKPQRLQSIPLDPLDPDAWILPIAAFASGCVFFALEVLWTHLIATVIGSSVFAFSAMLTMVLLGLLIAAYRVDHMVQRPSSTTYFILLQFSALLLVIQLRLWDWGQSIFLLRLPAGLSNFYGAEAVKLLLAGVLIVPSAAMLGSIYPSLLRSPIAERTESAYVVGYLNAANALGCLAGALLGVFVMIPDLGAERSLKLIIIGTLATAMLFLCQDTYARHNLIAGTLGVCLVLALAASIRWNPRMITSGLNVYYGENLPSVSSAPSPTPTLEEKVVFFDESVQGGMTSVIELQTREGRTISKTLLTNGKYEGTDGFEGQGRAQIGFAAIPSLFARNLDRAMLIGLGTGHSALALARVGYKDIDVAEFAPGIIKAARNNSGRSTRVSSIIPMCTSFSRTGGTCC